MVISPGNDSTIPNWVKVEEGTTLFHHISSASTLYMIWSFSKCSHQRTNKFKLSNPPHSDSQHEQQAPEVENKLTLWLARTFFPLQPRKSWVFQLSAPVRLKMELYWTFRNTSDTQILQHYACEGLNVFPCEVTIHLSKEWITWHSLQ